MKHNIVIIASIIFCNYTQQQIIVFSAPCQSDNECGLLEACIRGQCSNLCDQNRACGLNAICDMVNHKKQCTCPASFTGTAETECYRLPSFCQSGNDCENGFMCKSGGCVPKCKGNEDCAQNEMCIQGSCTREYINCLLNYLN